MTRGERLKAEVLAFVAGLATGVPGEHRMCRDGRVTLYASAFAALTLHELGALESLPEKRRRAWAQYLAGFQDPDTGHFLGPELTRGRNLSRRHGEEHLRMHLTAHVLPALAALGAKPAHPLWFARRFCDLKRLDAWLAARDLSQPWLEGNNLLFAGQFLIHLAEREAEPAAKPALERLTGWLDGRVDPASGLWGTDRGCGRAEALYGGYHQIILYHYLGRPLPHPEALIDSALSLQHPDGGFNLRGGGGTCEDVDAIYVLAAQYPLTDHRRPQVRAALRRALPALLRRRSRDGGFVYRRGESFMHQGLTHTRALAGRGELFSTWFCLHALGLITDVLADHPLAGLKLRFAPVCAMGWHQAPVARGLAGRDGAEAELPAPGGTAAAAKSEAKARLRMTLGGMAGAMGRALPVRPLAPVAEEPAGRLTRLMARVREEAALRRPAAPPVWPCPDPDWVLARVRPEDAVLVLGSGDGSLARSIAGRAAKVVGQEPDPGPERGDGNPAFLRLNPAFALAEGPFDLLVLQGAWAAACDRKDLIRRLAGLGGWREVLVCGPAGGGEAALGAAAQAAGLTLAEARTEGGLLSARLLPGGPS